PARPLPDETASAGVTKYSFIAYGDTRGRRDGIAIQYEHSLIVDSMLAQIKKHENTEYPIRFVLQAGDAVAHGQNAKEWNVSFVPLINRLTLEGDVPYFLAPGNHDVSSATTADDPKRQTPLKNYFDAVAAVIPPAGPRHRLSGYQTYSFGYGNTFALGFDADVAGGGARPLYAYAGEPNLDDYVKAEEASKVKLHHLVKPAVQRGLTPYRDLLVRVDGDRLDMHVIAVDWGEGFRPYTINSVELEDP